MSRKEAWGRFIPPKSDVAFKELMRNEEVRRQFVSDALGMLLSEIRSVRLENTFLSRRSRQEKQCILDIRVYTLLDKKGNQYSDQFEVHIIELNKELAGERMDDWIQLLRVKSKGELEAVRSGNAGVMKAVEEVRAMNLFRWAKWRYEEHLKYRRDMWAMEQAAKQEGHAAGHAEGHAEGHAAGLVQGDIERSRQVIYDFLGQLGDIPEDIRMRIGAEQDTDKLRRLYLAAPGIKSFDEFRRLIGSV